MLRLDQLCIELIFANCSSFSQALALASTCQTYYRIFRQPYVFGSICQANVSAFNLLHTSFIRGNYSLKKQIEKLKADVATAERKAEDAVRAFKRAPGTAVIYEYAEVGEDVWENPSGQEAMKKERWNVKGQIVSTVSDRNFQVGVTFGDSIMMTFRCGMLNEYGLVYSLC